MNQTVLSAREVCGGYGGVQVVHGVSLDVSEGEMLAIVGPNGAGKTTLLRMLGGLLAPESGVIELRGRPIREFTPRTLARQIASVAQETAAAFPLTVLEAVLMGRAPHLGSMRFESDADLGIARTAMARLELLALAHRPIQELSGGERRRAFLARAIAQEPMLALLDEPTAFLDMKHVASVFGLFRRLCGERNLALIASVHDLNVAALYSDRILLLKDGRVRGHGTADEVLTEKNLEDAYEVRIGVGRNPVTGGIAVFPANICTR